MSSLAGLRAAMTEFLKEQGIEALSAWPGDRRPRLAAPLAVVRIKQAEAGPAGFQNYLGQAYDARAGRWTERYGQTVTVRFGVDLYSPESRGETGCQQLLEQVADALQAGGPAGLSVEKWMVGESTFDTGTGLFLGTMQVVCRTLLVAVSDEYGAFLGFEVKGEIQL